MVALLLTAAYQTMSKAQQLPATLVITHITVIDVANGVLQHDMSVTITGDRITDLARSTKFEVPPRATVILGQGKFLIPGLWDMHVHLEGAPDVLGRLYLIKGITGVRDMRMEIDSLLRLRDQIRRGAILMPRVVASGPALDNLPPEYPLPVKIRVKNAADARSAVALLKTNGVDFIKVHNFTPRDAFFAVAGEARRFHLSFAGHVPLSVSVREATEAGIRSIEH